MTPNKILKLRQRILQRQYELNITPRHTKEGHFYYVPILDKTLPSVSGEHRNIKDPSLRNFEKNEALRYITNKLYEVKEYTMADFEKWVEEAKDAPIVARDTAGSKGNFIHDCREQYFSLWIKSGKVDKPAGTIEDIARRRGDVPPDLLPEVISGCAAMDRFITEWNYIPLGCEILVFDAKDEVAGTLDDVGVLTLKDGQQIIVLLDVKSSNQFKDTYTLQVMRYNKMFRQLFKIKPDRVLIVKTGKDDRNYKLEWFKPAQMVAGNEANKALIKFNTAWEQLLASRKKEPIVYVPTGRPAVPPER